MSLFFAEICGKIYVESHDNDAALGCGWNTGETMKRTLALLLAIATLAALFAACGGETPLQTTAAAVTSPTANTTAPSQSLATEPAATSAPQQTSAASATEVTATTAATTAPPMASKVALLYIPFDLELPDTFELPYIGELDVPILLSGLAGLTGWNCDVTKVDIFSDTARIDLSAASLPFSYDQLPHNETFFLPTYADTVFLFLDAVAQTLTKNLGLSGVIFTQDGGQPLVLERLHAAVELFPPDTLYRGSAYYRAQLLDDPYDNVGGYPMVQLASGLTVVYPNGFTVESETDTELRVSAEDRVFLTFRSFELTDEVLITAEQKMKEWASRMTVVEAQSFTEHGYNVSGTYSDYLFAIVGHMMPEKMQYCEIMFMYAADVDFVDMETVIAELTAALVKYN